MSGGMSRLRTGWMTATALVMLMIGVAACRDREEQADAPVPVCRPVEGTLAPNADLSGLVGAHALTLVAATGARADSSAVGRLTLEPARAAEFTVRVRVPGWALGRPVPSDLYRYLGDDPGGARLLVDGEEQDIELAKGFACVTRTWQKGDVLELELPMPVRRVLSHEAVEDNRGRVALERGPLVYCCEWPDNAESVLRLALPDTAELNAEFRQDLLGGLAVITGGAAAAEAARAPGESSPQVRFTAIPYYAWAHRGIGEMAVWLKRK